VKPHRDRGLSPAAQPVYGRGGRIGLIVPANNCVIEPEVWSVLPRDVAVYGTRLLVRGELTPELVRSMEQQLASAVDAIAATGVDAIVYCDMVTTFIMEPGWNEEAVARIRREAGVPAISAWTALRDALSMLEISAFALGTPYPTSIHRLAPAYFRDRGFCVVDDATLDIRAVCEVPTVGRGRLLVFAESLERDGAEAVVLLATDLPTFGVIAELERNTGLPVLTSNQALLWSALRTLGRNDTIPALGRLFTM
jgi:maleate isomerase